MLDRDRGYVGFDGYNLLPVANSRENLGIPIVVAEGVFDGMMPYQI